MNQYLSDAVEEIKRVDHLVTVSLSYTRTVDVIKSVINRMISTFDCLISALLSHLKEKDTIDEYPLSPAVRTGILRKHFKDNKDINELLDFYLLLRKIIRSEYEKQREFRRHVTMIAHLDDGETIEVTIDLLKEYFEKIKNSFKLVKEKVSDDEC